MSTWTKPATASRPRYSCTVSDPAAQPIRRRLGFFLVRRRRAVLGLALALFVLAGALVAEAVPRLSLARFEAPGSGFDRAAAQPAARFGADSPALIFLVTARSGTVDDQVVAAEGHGAARAGAREHRRDRAARGALRRRGGVPGHGAAGQGSPRSRVPGGLSPPGSPLTRIDTSRSEPGCRGGGFDPAPQQAHDQRLLDRLIDATQFPGNHH
ncbi:hypothetical protein [Nonomuraea salmonea]|uniref:hypothetical protein n=1 Tax=Nonomuraea salmonea TaxID=46181 RepID=UPI0031EBF8EE